MGFREWGSDDEGEEVGTTGLRMVMGRWVREGVGVG